MTRIRSFGEAEPVATVRGDDELPTPVLHVGEVTAELRLHITDDTVRDLGSQIASMLANAVRQGFEQGMAAAMGDLNDDPDLVRSCGDER